jgi:hypothetical protein
MEIAVLFDLSKDRRRTAIGEILLDVSYQESIALSSEVTRHPVETGSSISDHVFHNPQSVSIDGSITNTPIKIFDFSPLLGGSNRRLEAYEALRDINRNSQVVTLVTGLDVFDNMIMESITFSDEPGMGQKLKFSASFTQIERTVFDKVSLQSPKEDVKDLVSTPTNAGRQTAKQPTAEQSRSASAVAGNLTS